MYSEYFHELECIIIYICILLQEKVSHRHSFIFTTAILRLFSTVNHLTKINEINENRYQTVSPKIEHFRSIYESRLK